MFKSRWLVPVGFAVLPILASCAGSQEALVPLSSVGASSVQPNPTGVKASNLMYLLDDGVIGFYAYPDGSYVGTLPVNGAAGMCADGKGNVFVADADIYEYPHGGTSPSRTLSVPGQYPRACAVDPISNDVAVTNGYAPNVLYVYAPGSDQAQSYSAPGLTLMYPGYDAGGDLFVDAVDSTGSRLLELPHGKTSFEIIALKQRLGSPGSVQWDGKYITVEGQGQSGAGKLYRFAVKGKRGVLVGATILNCLAPNCGLSWIQHDKVLDVSGLYACEVTCYGTVYLQDYPSGKSVRSYGPMAGPWAAIVSVGR